MGRNDKENKNDEKRFIGKNLQTVKILLVFVHSAVKMNCLVLIFVIADEKTT